MKHPHNRSSSSSSSSSSYGAHLPSDLVPTSGRFGVLSCERIGGGTDEGLAVSGDYFVVLRVDGFGPVGICRVELTLSTWAESRPELAVQIKSVWVEPLLRRLGLSECLSLEVFDLVTEPFLFRR